MKKQANDYPIDFVITWVDDNDPKWKEDFNKYKDNDGDKRDIRFRDMDTLKYIFRGIEYFAPWVNKIFFVTCGQRPEWLNTNHPKLVCVDHKDYIPEKYLPTFSSHTIELNLHRINGLSEHFVYFNDDTYLTAPVSRNTFFQEGLPCISAVMSYYSTVERPPFLVPMANISVINDHFRKKDVLKENFWKFYTLKYHKYILRNIQFFFDKKFPGFLPSHMPASFLKSTFQEIWEQEYELLDSVCSHKFRRTYDVNQWLVGDWQICSGRFVPQDTKIGYRGLVNDNEEVINTVSKISSGKYKIVCVNDDQVKDFNFFKKETIKALNQILPQKSSFER